MKLHKLLYAAQGFHLAQLGTPEFEGRLEAWDDGPVEVDIYKVFAGRRYLTPDDLVRLGDPDALDEGESAAVDLALDYYGNFSGDALSDLSHIELPWREAYDRGRNSLLSEDLLADYFRQKLKRFDDDGAMALGKLLAVLNEDG